MSSFGIPGALKHLGEVRPGDRVVLSDASGHTTTWAIYELTSHVKTDLPRGLGTTAGDRRLVLVTCGGAVIQRSDGGHYRDNVVAYATPLD